MRPAVGDIADAARYYIGLNPTVETAAHHLREWAGGLDGADALTVQAEAEALVGVLKDLEITGGRKLIGAALRACQVVSDAESAQGTSIDLDDPEPWHDPVNGISLLNELRRTFLRFLALPEHADVALALWPLYTHAHDLFDVSPFLGITSPEMRCGKTRTLELLSLMVRRALPAANVTPAALFRTVEKYAPTLLIDEADTFAKRNDELRGILNSGHRRATAYIIRTTGDEHEPRRFSTWCPKAYALIGRMPETVMDRSIVVTMRRRAPHEETERLYASELEADMNIARRQMARWVADHVQALSAADPELPTSLDDRAADNWRPIIAIADEAGGDWPRLAREAAIKLSASSGDNSSTRVLLLRDIRDLFTHRGTDRLASQEIVEELSRMEERPWPEWRNGKPMTKRALAKQLEPFGIRPKGIRIADRTPRGYLRDEMLDAFTRYLTPKSATPQQVANGEESSEAFERNITDDVALSEESESPRGLRHVADVAVNRTGVERTRQPT